MSLLHYEKTKLLIVDSEIQATTLGALSEYLRENDLLVFNGSATVPASFQLADDLELRLASSAGPSLDSLREWWAVAFGKGDWRLKTEDRGAPRPLHRGEIFLLSDSLLIRILEIDRDEPRLVKVRIEGDDVMGEIYRVGRPIQYSYHRDTLAIWEVQTKLAGVPASVEPPSAALSFDWRLLHALPCRKAWLTHGAGLSSTGGASLDRRLPLAEIYSIPDGTLEAIRETHAMGGRIIAVGTTTCRALETYVRTGVNHGFATLKLGLREPARLVDGLITGVHEPGTSHFDLEQAFVPQETAARAFRDASALGFRPHEFGDLALLFKPSIKCRKRDRGPGKRRCG